jgi:hypothetical protein
MARASNKLSAVKVSGIARKGMNHDGAGFIFSEAQACGPAA